MSSSAPEVKLSIGEKAGYATGDMAANLVWRGALAYLAVFYTDTLGITATAAAMLLMLVRVSDGITDIIMGMIADRTTTRWGKFRPWIIASAPVMGLFMVLAFTAPDFSPEMKLVWAYFTYIGLTLAYTVNNVPYSALMGVMTPSHNERSVLSGYRFAGAFLGGLLVMSGTPLLVEYFGQGNEAQGYQYTMYIFAALLVTLCCITFFSTRERIVPVPSEKDQNLLQGATTLIVLVLALLGIALWSIFRSWFTFFLCVVFIAVAVIWLYVLINKPASERSKASNDLVDLITNMPWLMVLALGFLTMLFNGVKYGVIAYYFKHYVHDTTLTSYYFAVLLAVSMVAAFAAGYFTRLLGKKRLFIISLIASGLLTGVLFWIPADQYMLVFYIGGAAEFFAAFMPVLVFSMLGDSADYSEWKNGRRATGLAYSAGSFIQKTGGGFAGAIVLIVLANYGYVGTDPSTIAGATDGMRWLMSWIPAVFSFAGVLVLIFYPLDSNRMSEIEVDLRERRGQL